MTKRTSILIAAVLIVALAMPAVAVAKGPKSGNKPAAAGQANKEAREDKAARKAAKEAAKQERKQARSTEASPSTEATESFQPIETGNRNVAGAMIRITSNLERALEKVTAGTKKQLPPGLVRVWQKFAAWLGIDPTTQPGYVAPADDSSPTADATGTVEPTATVEPTPTVDPTATVIPTETPAPLEEPAP